MTPPDTAIPPAFPLPKDPRHQRFADLVLAGEPAAKAYQEAGFKAKSAQSRATSASRLLKNAHISRYMEAIRQKAAEGAVATVRYKREFLFLIMDTPLMAIDPNDPKRKHGRLVKKFKASEFGYEIEKHCPLKAIELDNKLSGDDADSNATAALAAAISSLAPLSPLPTGKM
jgi:hypothetical protein